MEHQFNITSEAQFLKFEQKVDELKRLAMQLKLPMVVAYTPSCDGENTDTRAVAISPTAAGRYTTDRKLFDVLNVLSNGFITVEGTKRNEEDFADDDL